MASSWDEDHTADDVHADAADEAVPKSRAASEFERALAVITAKQDILETVANNLNHVTRTMSGYAEMLERHLSIQDDIVGSEYALGVRGELEQLHTLLFHLRAIARNRKIDPVACQQALKLSLIHI